MIRLAIVGGRDYTDYPNFKAIVSKHIEKIGIPDEIISGGARGVDKFAEIYAAEVGISMVILKPEWDKHGKIAGLIRNTDIIERSTHVLALPTSKSRGTYDSIRKANDLNKSIKVIKV